MTYKTFNLEQFDALEEPMFLGRSINVSRFDQSKYEYFMGLTEKLHSFFWRPEEVDISRDRADWDSLTNVEKHVFLSNLKYQTLLDSVISRSVSAVLIPIASLAEVETYVETWSFSESIHSLSYTHIIRNLLPNPSAVFEDIIVNEKIIERAVAVTKYLDDLILHVQLYQSQGEGSYEIDGETVHVSMRGIKERLYLVMCVFNALEGIRFYVSFACSFSFKERSLLAGNGTIISLIARDENVHLSGTQTILNLWASGRDDPEMQEIAIEMKEQGRQILLEAAEQECFWAEELFKDGSIIGLNAQILKEYVQYITTVRLEAIGMESPYSINKNPIPWITSHLVSQNVQVAPQEAEISSYLVGQVDSSVADGDFDDFDFD